MAYQNSRIVGDVRCLWLFGLLCFDNRDVLHVAPSEDNVVVSLLCRWNEIVNFAAFSAERVDFFKGYRRLCGVDFVQNAFIAVRILSVLYKGKRVIRGCTEFDSWKRD